MRARLVERGLAALFALLLAGCGPSAPAGLAATVSTAANSDPALITTRTAIPPALPASGLAVSPTVTEFPTVPAASATAASAPAVSTPAASAPAASASPTLDPSPAPQVCSPLEGIAISELGLPDLLKEPFQPPRPGMDDGHHGADFAYWSRGERSTMQGLPVLAVLEGRVAGVIRNRTPYGNALIIETPLDLAPTLLAAALPTPQPTIPPIGSLTCPVDPTVYNLNTRSVYLLYAHMNNTPELTTGEPVRCGQPIGEVGTTGKSVNPHLHLEARFGPANAVFESMAHYDTAATEEERALYCTWRTSGLFEMFDPMSLFQ